MDKGETNIFVTTANEYIDLDYDNFSIKAYINLAANPGLKPLVERA